MKAYVHCHRQDIVHGDVHPRNILIGSDSSVMIIDFGMAHVLRSDNHISAPPHGGMSHFFQPEYIEAISTGSNTYLPTFASEQYSLGALIYLLLTGADYLNFSAERTAMFRQIVEDSPLPFSSHGVHPSPKLEAIIARSLNKEPDRRYSSLDSFLSDLEWCRDDRIPVNSKNELPSISGVQKILENILAIASFDGNLIKTGFDRMPKCSFKLGMTGLAYGIYRIACVREDTNLLAASDAWLTHAVEKSSQLGAFSNKKIGLGEDTVGKISPFHTLSGVFAVQALIAHSMGEDHYTREAIANFIIAGSRSCDIYDVTLGKSSLLLISSLLLRAIGDSQPLRDFGQDVFNDIENYIDQRAPIPEDREIQYLGIAHGWAGILYALMRWLEVSGKPLPANLVLRLRQLNELAEPFGRGLRWKVTTTSTVNVPHSYNGNYMPGWCNGSAGYVHLWSTAYSLFRETSYLRLAEAVAWSTWDDQASMSQLCCGLAGQAYALLRLYQVSQEVEWLHRARILANRSASANRETEPSRYSLYRGDLGLAVLAADLESVGQAAMPFFGENCQ